MGCSARLEVHRAGTCKKQAVDLMAFRNAAAVDVNRSRTLVRIIAIVPNNKDWVALQCCGPYGEAVLRADIGLFSMQSEFVSGLSSLETGMLQ